MLEIHHVAIFSADYAATADFYREVFDAEAPEQCHQPSVVTFGGVTLHVFERSGVEADWAPRHLHHFAVRAADADRFVAVRERLLTRGACETRVIDFGEHASLLATDPDGGMVEVLVAIDDRDGLPFTLEPHA